MQINSGDFTGYSSTLEYDYKDKTIALLLQKQNDVQRFRLPDDIVQFKVLDKESARTGGSVFKSLIFFLLIGGMIGLVFPIALPIGLALWVCWLLGNKKLKVVAAFEMKSGQKFRAALDDKDWRWLKTFITE